MSGADPGAAAGAPAAGDRVTVTVNGEPHVAAARATALDVVVSLGLEGRPVAVEVNERVVPRRHLGDCMLSSGDRLEIVTLVGGG